MIEIDVKIEANDLYDYMMAHTYSSASGLIGSCVGALMVTVGIMKAQWIFAIFGVVLLVYLPWTLWIKSRQQALNPTFKKPLHYSMDEEGIKVSQGDAIEGQKWEEMYKAVSTRRSIIIYTTRINATILPRKELGDQKDRVIEMISTHMPHNKVKIKY